MLEAMLAVTVLAFGLTAYSALIGGIIDAERGAHRRTVATALAVARLEMLRALPAAGVADGADPPLNGAGRPDEPDSMYTRSWTVLDNTPVAGARTVTVTCSWPDKDGSKAIRLTSVILS